MLPQPDEDAGPREAFRRFTRSGRLAIQACTVCGRRIFPPRVLCPACGSTQLDWREAIARGTVHAATTIHRRDGDPYTVGLIDLDDGARVMATIDDAVADVPPIGEMVAIVIADSTGDEPVMLVASLAGAAAGPAGTAGR
jgi:hypothetical protein